MLRRLTVKNLAIVEDLEMELGPGLTVITGETGAGKSILVDALALLAGGRGASDLIRHGASRLLVAGEFEADGAAREILKEAGLPDSETLLLRRELASDGRGRAFVEDEPAAIKTLARLGERLLTIHGQYAERELMESQASLELLDAFARAQAETEATRRTAENWSAAREALESLTASRRDREARLDLLSYQIREIEAAAPQEGEEEELLSERARLAHADRIRRAGETALAALLEEENSAADRLGEAVRAFSELAAIDPKEAANLEEAQEVKRRISDLAAAARDAARPQEEDPDRLTAVESRLEKLSRLKGKYGGSLAQVRRLLDGMKEEFQQLFHLGDALERLEREEQASREEFRASARALSRKRQAAAGRFSAAVERDLRSLAMEKARFRVVLSEVPEAPRSAGLDAAAFLFAPNPGEPEKPVERIASGGELSRLQLAVQSVAADRSRGVRTLIFDEVDSGIGGRTAEVVGRKLRTLALSGQVLCVTHVPQIAALADWHFLAEKEEIRGRTVARVRLLEGKERVNEVARMLAGEEVPETAMRHARTLLTQAGH